MPSQVNPPLKSRWQNPQPASGHQSALEVSALGLKRSDAHAASASEDASRRNRIVVFMSGAQSNRRARRRRRRSPRFDAGGDGATLAQSTRFGTAVPTESQGAGDGLSARRSRRRRAREDEHQGASALATGARNTALDNLGSDGCESR